MNENQLVEIPLADWPKLRDLYESRKSQADAFNLLHNYIEWLRKDSSIDFVKIYSLNGDWSDGTFILQDSNYYTMLNTLSESYDRFKAALNCLDKKSTFLFNGFPSHLLPAIESYMLQFGIKREVSPFTKTIWYHISLKDALNFNTEPPEGFTLSSLTLADVDTINNLWPHRHPGSEVYVGRLIALSPSIGAYDKNGELVAWCLQLPLGALGLLHVKDDHKRRGFGNLMVRALSKKFAEAGIEVTAPVVETNAPSRSMFTKLGFQEIDTVLWWERPAVE